MQLDVLLQAFITSANQSMLFGCVMQTITWGRVNESKAVCILDGIILVVFQEF
jgi:hypothetical protein